MAVAYGTRINDDTNFITEIDLDNNTCETTGYIDGEAVDFSGGGSSDFSKISVSCSVAAGVMSDVSILFIDTEENQTGFHLLEEDEIRYISTDPVEFSLTSESLPELVECYLHNDDYIEVAYANAISEESYIITGDAEAATIMDDDTPVYIVKVYGNCTISLIGIS